MRVYCVFCMKLKKSDITDFVKAVHGFSGRLSGRLGELEDRVEEALSKVPMDKKLDFYESLTNIHASKNQLISNTITEIHNYDRRQETETTTCAKPQGG